MKLDHLAKPPFNLADDDIAWVAETAGAMSLEAKVAQLFILLSPPGDTLAVGDMAALQAGGVTRYYGADLAAELEFIDRMLDAARIPPLVCTDLEGSRLSFAFGTQIPNALAIAAIDDLDATRTLARITAREAGALGVNWSFTPCIDINAAFRSSIVGTRSFGSDLDRIARHGLAQIEELQKAGIAATAKHFPGEGYDDRDQHLLTTCNPLSIVEWEATFGKLYRAAIDAGVLSIMAGHIAFPAFARLVDPDAGAEAFRPGSLSRVINVELLRNRLGFNGLIVSDASEMGGVTSWGPARQGKIDILKNGCDMILFTRAPAADFAAVTAAAASGEIPLSRVDEALSRVLGLKARLGLHKRKRLTRAERRAALGRSEDKVAAAAITARAPTLVKDVNALFPISPQTHRRVLILTTGIADPMKANVDFAFPALMRQRGFEVTIHEPGQPIVTSDVDLVLYVMAEETLLTRGRIFMNWNALGGSFVLAMRRTWHEVPTALISFGYPYYLYDAPRMPAVVNAYSTLDGMQEAVLDCMLGKQGWNRHSPVDPFCGLEDAVY